MTYALIAAPGAPELVLILLVIVLLFGAKKLPELARGSGRALRIFKAETKGLADDDVDEDVKTPEQRELEARQPQAQVQSGPAPQVETEADRVAREQRGGSAG